MSFLDFFKVDPALEPTEINVISAVKQLENATAQIERAKSDPRMRASLPDLSIAHEQAKHLVDSIYQTAAVNSSPLTEKSKQAFQRAGYSTASIYDLFK